MKFDNIIIGAGLAGIVTAERLANLFNQTVLIIEKRNHIGGNCYDYYHEEGILIHKYGPHIFHTNNKKVWDYLSKFTDWYLYQHKTLAYVNGNFVPFPINLNTINNIYNLNLTSDELYHFFDKIKVKIENDNIKNSKDMIVSKIGEDLYELFFKYYTKKQWDLYPEELAPEVTARIPIRYNKDDRYFNDKYQGLPKYGYTKMFENMLKNNKIKVLLNTDYKEIINELEYKNLFCSAPIDYFFDYKYGKLAYRSLIIDFEVYDTEEYQKAGVVNYPNDYDFTRITEYKKLTGQKHKKTIISKEYPVSEGEEYYPVPREENYLLYDKYKKEAEKLNNVKFIGRLGTYKYLNMDKVVENILELFENYLIGELK